jgi:hypothetical protein
MVTHNPLHRSGQAGLPHPAVTSGNSERSLPPVAFVDIHPTHRLRSIRSSLRPMGEVLEVILEGLAGCGFLFQTEVGHTQRFQVVDVLGKRREPHLLILTGCLTYPLRRTGRVRPALRPGRVLLGQVPFGQIPSLHLLRRRLPGLVRGRRRYYGSVRLPVFVHHRRMPLDFPMRPHTYSVWGERGISRFPREVLSYVHGVCDHAGLWHTSRDRCTRWGLPLSPPASASRRKVLTGLYTRPARSPVNASRPLLRAAPHDSGTMWVASSHSYDFCIHYTSPV